MQKIYAVGLIYITIFCVVPSRAESPVAPQQKIVPTHSDAAMILAKHARLFDRYVEKDASLNDCVSFLNSNGVYFGLLEVVNGSEFTKKDCARVMGQIELIFTGEASYLAGKVILPKDIASWEEFCTMEAVDYVQGYEAVVQALQIAVKLNH